MNPLAALRQGLRSVAGVGTAKRLPLLQIQTRGAAPQSAADTSEIMGSAPANSATRVVGCLSDTSHPSPSTAPIRMPW